MFLVRDSKQLSLNLNYSSSLESLLQNSFHSLPPNLCRQWGLAGDLQWGLAVYYEKLRARVPGVDTKYQIFFFFCHHSATLGEPHISKCFHYRLVDVIIQRLVTKVLEPLQCLTSIELIPISKPHYIHSSIYFITII